jgi:hypothetical protein
MMMMTKQAAKEHSQHITASRAYLDRAREAMDKGQWKEADALMTRAADRLRAAEGLRRASETV